MAKLFYVYKYIMIFGIKSRRKKAILAPAKSYGIYEIQFVINLCIDMIPEQSLTIVPQRIDDYFFALVIFRKSSGTSSSILCHLPTDFGFRLFPPSIASRRSPIPNWLLWAFVGLSWPDWDDVPNIEKHSRHCSRPSGVGLSAPNIQQPSRSSRPILKQLALQISSINSPTHNNAHISPNRRSDIILRCVQLLSAA